MAAALRKGLLALRSPQACEQQAVQFLGACEGYPQPNKTDAFERLAENGLFFESIM
jgi:hypothetical protein